MARVTHWGAGDSRRGVRAVAVGVPRRLVLALEILLRGVAAVPPRADDLPVAVARVERLAGLAHAFPPLRHGAIPGVVEAP